MSTSSAMTWLEEWVFVFELLYGRREWEDLEHNWLLCKKSLRTIFLGQSGGYTYHKTELADVCDRLRALRIRHLESVIFHYCTNVQVPDSSDSDLHRALHSEYYSMNCGKGGVATQQCGFIRNIPLAVGAIGDQGFLSVTQIFEKQKYFTEKQDASSSNPM
jgi:hypothetical protein